MLLLLENARTAMKTMTLTISGFTARLSKRLLLNTSSASWYLFTKTGNRKYLGGYVQQKQPSSTPTPNLSTDAKASCPKGFEHWDWK